MIKNSKAEARQLVKLQLDALAVDEYESKSRIVYEHVASLLKHLQGNQQIRTILSYHAMEQWREVDVSALSKEFLNIQIDYIPQDRFTPFPLLTYDAILVPLYGFNSEKFRLGHGIGWYDKFLTTQSNAIKIGIGLEAGHIVFSPDTHDVRMDSIVTEV